MDHAVTRATNRYNIKHMGWAISLVMMVLFGALVTTNASKLIRAFPVTFCDTPRDGVMGLNIWVYLSSGTRLALLGGCAEASKPILCPLGFAIVPIVQSPFRSFRFGVAFVISLLRSMYLVGITLLPLALVFSQLVFVLLRPMRLILLHARFTPRHIAVFVSAVLVELINGLNEMTTTAFFCGHIPSRSHYKILRAI